MGSGGTILATTDGGETWKAQTSGSTESLNGVSFADAWAGWAVGDGGTTLATDDGGATWDVESSGTSAGLYAVTF